MKCNTAITIYNKYYDKAVGYDRWQRTVINDVHWFKKTKTTVASTGLIAADETKIRIPLPVDYTFIDPDDWPKVADKTDCWTLQPGDRIVMGESTQEITKASALTGAVTILGWGDNRHGLNPHWGVTCQ